MARVPGGEATRKAIKRMFEGEEGAMDISGLVRQAVEKYARGLSMRDIEAAFTAVDGHCVLSKSAAPHACAPVAGSFFDLRHERSRSISRRAAWPIGQGS